jgi:hypothetical protein
MMLVFRRRLVARLTLLLAFVLGLVSLTTPFRAAETLPSEISDETFSKMMTEMSERDGFFQFDNFLSNELGYQYVIPRLVQGTEPGGVYLGVAPEQNFTYIAALKPKMAFIIDIRRQNMIELLMYKSFFEMSETRADFLSKLFARKRPEGLTERSTAAELFDAYAKVRPDTELYKENFQAVKDLLVKTHKYALRPTDLDGFSSIEFVYSTFVDQGPTLDYGVGGVGAGGNNPSYADLMVIDDGVGKNWSYLASEENYRFIRDLEKKNLIVPLVGDFAGPKTIRAVGQFLKDRDAIVTAFYLSNVEQYLFNEYKSSDFYDNVATLPLNSKSTFIRSFSGGGFGGGLGGGSFRFLSTLSSMRTLLDEFKAGRVRQYGDVRNLSQ